MVCQTSISGVLWHLAKSLAVNRIKADGLTGNVSKMEVDL